MESSDIKALKNTQSFQRFVEYVRTKAQEIDSLADIDFTEKESAVIEALARRKAIETLAAILEPFMEIPNVYADRKKEKEEDAGVA